MDTFSENQHPAELFQFLRCEDCPFEDPTVENCNNCPMEEPEGADYENDVEPDPFLNDVEADADALASAGWGTDEDYGFYDAGGDEW